MEASRHSVAIILNRSDYRESDSLITAYTKDFGRLSLVARGAKKPSSKLSGHLEPLSLTELLIINGRAFDYVGGALTTAAFLNLKDNLNKLYFAGRAVNRFSQLVKENEPDENLFFLLFRFLEFLDNYPETDFSRETGELFLAFFLIKLLVELGYQPEMQACLSCREKISPGKNYFNLRNGGLVCRDCLEKDQASGRANPAELLTISDNCIKLIRFIINNQFAPAKKLRLSRRVIKEVAHLSQSFFDFNS